MAGGDDMLMARHEGDLLRVRQRADKAVLLLGLIAVSRAITASWSMCRLAVTNGADVRDLAAGPAVAVGDILAGVASLLVLVLLALTPIFFIRWLKLTVRIARALAAPIEWTPAEAASTFFIPLLNLVLPYKAVRDIYRGLAPDLLPEPPPQTEADGSAGYREVRFLIPPPAAKIPTTSIRAWWACYLAPIAGVAVLVILAWAETSVTARTLASALSEAFSVPGALLAIQVVRAITARLVERYRRIRHNPGEVLRAAGVVLG
jgi:hypothetical protein